LSEYTPGFDRTTIARDIAASADLSGRLALVTGASSGLGVEIARGLAAAGADLVLCVRDPAKVAGIADALRREGARMVEVEPLDLCDFASVARAASAIGARHAALDLLIANAGASKTPASHQGDGIDVRFAGNHLGHFLLAQLLHPLLALRGARIVMLSSAAHRGRPVRFDDLGWTKRPMDEFAAYGESKTANILFAIEASRRWAGDGITANAVLPGTILTGLQRYHGEALKQAMGFIGPDGSPHPLVKTPEQGAATAVWAATAPELAGRGGMVLEDCAPSMPHTGDHHPWSGYDAAVLDDEAAGTLWQASLEMLAACKVNL